MKSEQSIAFHFRCPPDIKSALETEAERQLISPSAYMRRALVQSLQCDGAIAGRLRKSEPDSARSHEAA